jgi:hypothetical protein
MVVVVIAHYKENLEWVKNLKYKYVIISKEKYQPEEKPNKGFEASSYLEYIINNYDDLNEYTIFVHGHRSSWHHTENIDEKINNLVFDKNYYNINENPLSGIGTGENSYEKTELIYQSLRQILNMDIIIENIYMRGCAQFYVHRDCILRHNKDTYIKLYNYLMETNEISYWTSRAFEYIYHLIFTLEHRDIE